jgi:hypothetical protein
MRCHRGARAATARLFVAQKLAHAMQVGGFELVEPLELVERLESLGGAARSAERTENALRMVPVDAGRVPAVSKRRRGKRMMGREEGGSC